MHHSMKQLSFYIVYAVYVEDYMFIDLRGTVLAWSFVEWVLGDEFRGK